jgi:hypothetical protein
MERQSVGLRGLKPWGSPSQMHRAPIGYQIAWERVSNNFKAGTQSVTANGAASVGADAITVDALLFALRRGETIDFGEVETVIVTVGAAGAAQGAVSVPVDALSGPLPSGAVLSFGGAKFARLTAAAAAGAVTITVAALPTALVDNDAATFQGGQVVVTVLEDTAEGATSVPVSNLSYGIADNAEGKVQREGISSGDYFIPEATFMSLDATSQKMFPRADANGVDEPIIGAIASDASNSKWKHSDSRSGYGLVVQDAGFWENLAPDADVDGNLPAGWKTEIAENTLGFTFRDWSDTRVPA